MSASDHDARSTWQVARSPNVRRYLVGNSASNIGTWCYNLAAGILVYRLTGSALLVGLATSAQFVGTVVLAPWAGSAADRFDRRRLLMLVQSIGALISGSLAALVALDRAPAPLVIAASALLGLGIAVSTPALQALVPSLVDRPSDLDTAVALNSVTFNVARALGPLVAAVLIDRSGVAAAMALNAVSYLVFVVALTGLPHAGGGAETRSSVRFRKTVAEVWSDRTVRRLLVSVAAVSVTVDPVTTLAPVFAVDVFGRDEAFAGVLLSSFGVGATVTALTMTGMLRRSPNSLAWTLALTSIGITVAALAPRPEIGIVGLAIAGGGSIGSVTRATARLHQAVAPSSLGRVMALWGLAFLGTRPAAAMIDGAIADAAGARIAATVMATAGVASSLSWMLARRRAAEGTAGGGLSRG